MPKRATGENTTETTNPMTWHARGCAIYASGEIAGTWSKVQCPVPDWWLADPQKTARHTFDKQKRALICERALQEVMARDWFGDLRAIDNAAVQIAREAAAEVGAPPDAVADPRSTSRSLTLPWAMCPRTSSRWWPPCGTCPRSSSGQC